MSVLLPKPATMQQGELLLGKDVLNKKQLCVKYGCNFDVPILHGLKLCTLVCLQLIPFSLSHESYQFIDLKKYDNFRKVSYFSNTHQFILGSAILCWVESPVHCVHTATLPHVSVFHIMLRSLLHISLLYTQLQFLLCPVLISRSYTLCLVPFLQLLSCIFPYLPLLVVPFLPDNSSSFPVFSHTALQSLPYQTRALSLCSTPCYSSSLHSPSLHFLHTSLF